MLIGELSRKTGVSRDTIRFYEKIGMIERPVRSSGRSGYKDYPQGTAEKIVFIGSARGMGFTLKEIALFLSFWKEEQPCSGGLQALDEKIDELNHRISALEAMRERAANAARRCRDNQCELSPVISSFIQR